MHVGQLSGATTSFQPHFCRIFLTKEEIGEEDPHIFATFNPDGDYLSVQRYCHGSHDHLLYKIDSPYCTQIDLDYEVNFCPLAFGQVSFLSNTSIVSFWCEYDYIEALRWNLADKLFQVTMIYRPVLKYSECENYFQRDIGPVGVWQDSKDTFTMILGLECSRDNCFEDKVCIHRLEIAGSTKGDAMWQRSILVPGKAYFLFRPTSPVV